MILLLWKPIALNCLFIIVLYNQQCMNLTRLFLFYGDSLSHCISILMVGKGSSGLTLIAGLPILTVSLCGVRYFLSHHDLTLFNIINIVILFQSYGPVTLHKNVLAYADIYDVMPIRHHMLALCYRYSRHMSYTARVRCDTFSYGVEDVIWKKVFYILKTFSIWECINDRLGILCHTLYAYWT